MTESTENVAGNFIIGEIERDLAEGRYTKVITRLPPEPNAYLHIGHAKAFWIDYGMAERFGGECNLRFDDTNPAKEDQEYIDAIKTDTAWLGMKWARECYASDYFPLLFDWAIKMVEAGYAYVDERSADEIRETRGSLTTPGTPSPFRDRPADESVDLFSRMRAGEFANGACVLRAKIDMAHGNMNMRDPIMYRIMHLEHHRTGDEWCIYPSYDWTHGQSDWIEGITHSLCSLEYENHRPLYDWFLDKVIEIGITSPVGCDYRPRQIEFARGNLTHMITSKRKLLKMIEAKCVSDWDDPRLPTLHGLRRGGVQPQSIRRFWEEAGVAKRENNIEIAKFESIVRDDLNKVAQRRMAVLDPLKVVITNYPEDQVEQMDVVNNPEDESAGTRQVPFSREIYIEHDDFMEDPPRKFFRLCPGREVRLRSAYWVKCEDVIKDDAGNIIELHCTYDPNTRGGNNPPPEADGTQRKVKGTLHWVSAAHAIDAEVRLYDHLFELESPEDVPEGVDWLTNVNADSLQVKTGCKLEPSLANFQPGQPIQFERIGYFTADADGTTTQPVFNRTIGLRDSWAKQKKK